MLNCTSSDCTIIILHGGLKNPYPSMSNNHNAAGTPQTLVPSACIPLHTIKTKPPAFHLSVDVKAGIVSLTVAKESQLGTPETPRNCSASPVSSHACN